MSCSSPTINPTQILYCGLGAYIPYRGKAKTGVEITKRAMVIASPGPVPVLSFGASAVVQQVNAEQAQSLQSTGTISVSQVGSAPMNMCQELAVKTEKEGASNCRIIETRTGDS